MSNYRRRLLAAVAAEEDGYFYICHSSTGIIEKLPLTSEVNWPSLVSSSTQYGGLFSDWAGKGDYAKAIENGEFDNLEFIDGKLQDVNYNSYNGDTFTTSNRFARGKAFTSIQTPEKNKIYYICEPRSEYFDKIVGRYEYNNNIINRLVLITSVDSSYYSMANIIIKEIEQSKIDVFSARFVSAYSDAEVTVNPSYISPELQRGYVVLQDIISYLSQNKHYDVHFKLTTSDGYELLSSNVYIYTGDLTVDTFKVQSYPFD